MRQLRHEATIFFSTHILDDVQKICDHVAIINYGSLIAQGAIEERGDVITAGCVFI